MPRKPRRQYFVQGSVQKSLLARIALYFGYLVAASFLAAMLWMAQFDRPDSWNALAGRMLYIGIPLVAAATLLLPIVLFDCLRFSNRFVGPLLRLSRAMDRLADGERVHNIEFRQGDFWFHIAQTFNRLNERIIRMEQQAKERCDRVIPESPTVAIEEEVKSLA
jgi:nitrogen fixation/metabolism regulation signal transduction histidine kinase